MEEYLGQVHRPRSYKTKVTRSKYICWALQYDISIEVQQLSMSMKRQRNTTVRPTTRGVLKVFAVALKDNFVSLLAIILLKRKFP